MSYPEWPAGLVQFERSGWQLQPQEARRRRQSDAGPPGFRRRFSSAARNVSLSLVVPRWDLARFWNFYREDCAAGASYFWMPDPSTDGWRLLTEAGHPVLAGGDQYLLLSARWLCSWGDDPPRESVYAGPDYRLNFSVWVMP